MNEAEGQASPNGLPPEPRQASSGRSKLPWLLALLASAVLAAVLWLGTYAHSPAPVTADTTVFIPKGSGAREIGAILARHQLLADDPRFLLLAALTMYSDNEKAGLLAAMFFWIAVLALAAGLLGAFLRWVATPAKPAPAP